MLYVNYTKKTKNLRIFVVVLMGQGFEWQTPVGNFKDYRLFEGEMEKLREIIINSKREHSMVLDRYVASHVPQFPTRIWAVNNSAHRM